MTAISTNGPVSSERERGQEPVRILVVEDEPSISGFVRRGLIYEGYHVEVVEDGKSALRSVADKQPDLMVLDIMLPEIDGIEVCRRIRALEVAESRRPIPILMLTARDAVSDRIAGLETGADDYLIKPFAFDELLARIRAIMRRARPTGGGTDSERLTFDDLVLDLGGRTAVRASRQIELTPREYDLLALFLRHPNQVLPRGTIMSRIWGDDYFGDSNVLEVFVGNLRRALEAGGEERLLQTVRGVGYVLRLGR